MLRFVLLFIGSVFALPPVDVEPQVDPLTPDYTIYDYGKECAEKLGAELPRLDCTEGTELKIYVNGKVTRKKVVECDNPAHLETYKACVPGARLQKIEQEIEREGRKEKITTMVLCRRKRVFKKGSPLFNDIGVIQYNEATNEACFFYMLSEDGTDSSDVTPPYSKAWAKDSHEGKKAEAYWRSPQHHSASRCNQCHDTGPWIRTPYVAQADLVPENRNRGPVRIVGKLNQSWNEFKPEKIDINSIAFLRTLPEKERLAYREKIEQGLLAPPGKCTECHSLGTMAGKWLEDGGTGTCRDLVPSATGRGGNVNTHKLSAFGKTFPQSHWMPPSYDWPRDFGKGEAGKKEWEAYYSLALRAVDACCKDPKLSITFLGIRIPVCKKPAWSPEKPAARNQPNAHSAEPEAGRLEAIENYWVEEN